MSGKLLIILRKLNEWMSVRFTLFLLLYIGIVIDRIQSFEAYTIYKGILNCNSMLEKNYVPLEILSFRSCNDFCVSFLGIVRGVEKCIYFTWTSKFLSEKKKKNRQSVLFQWIQNSSLKNISGNLCKLCRIKTELQNYIHFKSEFSTRGFLKQSVFTG